MGGDFAGDFAEVVHAFAYVLAHEVAADALVQAVDGSCEGFACVYEGFVVACVGHYHLVAVGFGQRCCRDEHLLQGVEAGVLSG